MLITKAHAAQPVGGEFSDIGRYELPTSISAASGNLANLFSNLFNFITFIAGLAFTIYFILGALKWITAGGDAQKVDSAKTQMTQAAIGLIIVVASYGVIEIVSVVLGLNILEPSTILENL